MKSIDSLLDRQKTLNYHCVHFVIEAGQYLFDYDYTPHFVGMTDSVDSAKTSKEIVSNADKVLNPKNGTVVLMTGLDGRLHVGIYYQNKILHLADNGVLYQAMRQIERLYKRFRYYEPVKNI